MEGALLAMSPNSASVSGTVMGMGWHPLVDAMVDCRYTRRRRRLAAPTSRA